MRARQNTPTVARWKLYPGKPGAFVSGTLTEADTARYEALRASLAETLGIPITRVSNASLIAWLVRGKNLTGANPIRQDMRA